MEESLSGILILLQMSNENAILLPIGCISILKIGAFDEWLVIMFVMPLKGIYVFIFILFARTEEVMIHDQDLKLKDMMKDGESKFRVLFKKITEASTEIKVELSNEMILIRTEIKDGLKGVSTKVKKHVRSLRNELIAVRIEIKEIAFLGNEIKEKLQQIGNRVSEIEKEIMHVEGTVDTVERYAKK